MTDYRLSSVLRIYSVSVPARIAGELIRASFSLSIEDFEDALGVVCAQKINADYIITRDENFLSSVSPVKLINPKDFVTALPPPERA